MYEEQLKVLLKKLAAGQISEEQAMEELRHLPFENLGFACIDQHRQLRQGLPEVIFCPGKSPAQILEIAERLNARNNLVLATRCTEDQAAEIQKRSKNASYHKEASFLNFGEFPRPDSSYGKVALITAGTSDLTAAHEARLTLASCRIESELYADLGVAGLHRLFAFLPQLKSARLAIVFAGMDGALPSVVGGLLSCPLIACPTSIGYGSAFGGLAPLLSMLNSCAAGLTVVNIDNGFGAALAAFRILHSTKRSAAETRTL